MALTKVTNSVVSSGSATDGYVLTADGSGGSAWEESAGGVAGIVSSADATAITIDSSENVGIGTSSPSSYYSGADNLVVSQSSGEGGITIVTANNTYGNLYFADGTAGADAYRGGIIYGHSANNMNFYTNGSERVSIDSVGVLKVNGGTINSNGTIKLQIGGSDQIERTNYGTTFKRGADSNNYTTLDAATNCYFTFGATNAYITNNSYQIMKFLGTLVYIPTAFSNATAATHRDVWVEDSGELGYNSSVRASKMNIEDVTDASWMYNINPKTFYRRKKDEDGNYLDTNDGIKEYGFIAEDIEEHAPELCFYDVDRESTIDEHGTEIFSEEFTRTDLAGIYYSQLTVPMLKLIQEQKQLIDDLTTRITALENA